MEDNRPQPLHQKMKKEYQVSDEMEKEDALIQNELKDDSLVISIKGMLQNLSPQSSECCIYKIQRRLREVNKKAYTPQVVSIGPFHSGTDYLLAMENHKVRHLNAFLHRTGRSLEYCLHMVRMWEQKARNCYAETFEMSSDEFVKMILVDGTFLVELLLREKEWTLLFDKPWMLEHVTYDMILLENQLPFFVLDGFFNLVPQKNYSFQKLVHGRFEYFLKMNELPNEFPTSGVKHFLDFIHRCYVSSIPKQVQQSPIPEIQSSSSAKHKHPINVTKQFVNYMRSCYPKVQHKGNIGIYERPPSVTKLHQAGIKFKKGTSNSLFDIKFANGVLEIPQLNIEDSSESWFRNLIAYEQCHGTYYGIRSTYDPRIFSDYFALFDGIIETSKDADLLIHYEVIRSMLGSSEEVSALFNNIFKEVIIDGNNFYFSSICLELNAYCKSPWYKR